MRARYREFILKHIPNKKTFVDVGTNVGIWSRPMKAYFNSVISYEPSKQNLECLKANIPTGIDLREKAVANFTGFADFIRLVRIAAMENYVGKE
jgi:FkbM family methyltransferase